MNARYRERVQVASPVMITVGSLVGEGRILDLTVPGCLIKSTLAVKKGEYVKLRVFLPGLQQPVSVELAAVRWTKGTHFGVEFIKMNQKERRRLNQFMGQRLSHTAPNKEGNHPRLRNTDGRYTCFHTNLLTGVR